MKKIIVTLATLSTALLFSASALANCEFDPGGAYTKASLGVGRILSEPNQPVGHILGEVEISTPLAKFTCSKRPWFFNTIGAFNEPALTVPNAIKTDIPGVGIIIEITAGSITGFLPLNKTLDSGSHTIDKIKMTLVKISTEQPVGSINTSYVNIGVNSSGLVTLMDLSIGNNTFGSSTCDVRSRNINVLMGTSERHDFSGVGSMTNRKEFSIRTSCFAGTKVKFKIDATPDSSGKAGVMAIDPGDGTASGVGIFLLHNNAPVKFGVETEAGTTLEHGDYYINFAGYYYQTQRQITAGKANGTATFTVTYN